LRRWPSEEQIIDDEIKPDLPGTRLEDAEAVMQALEQCQVDAILGSKVVMLVRPREVVETERKLAEALRQSEQRFRLALTNSPVSVFEQDLDLRYTWIHNPKLGFVADQVIGKTDAELVDPASAATLEALKRGVIDTGQPIRQEVATVVRGEPPTCFDLYVEPHRDEDGRIIGVICASTDITGRKAIDEQLRRSEALYRGIGESIDYGVWVCDPDGRNTYASESFLKMVGITQQQCSDFGWGDVLHPDDAAATLAAWQECVRTGGDWNREHRFRGVDGAWHHVLARGVPIRDEQGTVVSWAGINLDITALKEAQDEMRANEQRMRLATEATGVGIWEWNLFTNRIHWDAEMFRIYGIAPTADGDMQYADWSQAVLPEDLPRQEEILQDTARRHGHSQREFRIRHRASGEIRHIEAVEAVRTDAQGQAEWLVGTNLDVTARWQAEQALRESDRHKDEFLAMLAHELRNPMAPIRNAAHVLGKLDLPESRVRWAQEVIERQVGHLTRLVDDLLDVSRIAQGKITLSKARIALDDVIRQACEAVQPLMAAKGHRFEVRLSDSGIMLDGDPVRLVQVLQNLLNNAAKYTPHHGLIELAARRLEQEVEIEVSDNGMGIAADLLARVFDLFRQAERTLDRSQGGLGIGLTLVKRLVDLHGGRVEARSAGPGQGATFVVWLPLADSMAAVSQSPIGTPQGGATQLRVLVVDDDPAVAESMVVFLELDGHQVRSAASGIDALPLLEEFQPQVVLLDLGLPGLDGYEVARRMRATPAGAGVKLVAVSGYGNEEAKERSRLAGFDRHLIKPVDPSELCALLAEVGAQA